MPLRFSSTFVRMFMNSFVCFTASELNRRELLRFLILYICIFLYKRDKKDRWEESKRASETKVSGQFLRIMEGESEPNTGLQRTDCSGSAWRMVANVVDDGTAT